MSHLNCSNLNIFENALIPHSSYNNDIVVVEITGEHKELFDFDEDAPVRMEAFCLILICKGEMEITLDYTPYHLTANTFLSIVHHLVGGVSISSDFLGYQIFVSRNFIEDTIGKERPIPLSLIVGKHFLPYRLVEEHEMAILTDLIVKLKRDILRKEHAFQRNLIINGLSIILIEIGNIIFQKRKNANLTVELSRNEEIVKQFFQLIHKHCKEEHEVTFYAKELCMTPEYLSRMLKKTTQHTASKWIANALITEAKILLRDSNLSIQQITDRLNFSDQSSFGKFFKKHRGMSPLTYRKRLIS